MILTSKPAWEALYKDNQEAFKLEADRIITKVATTTGLAGNYSVSVKCTKPNIWYAKGYVVYTDKNGEEQTVYSDVVIKLRGEEKDEKSIFRAGDGSY